MGGYGHDKIASGRFHNHLIFNKAFSSKFKKYLNTAFVILYFALY